MSALLFAGPLLGSSGIRVSRWPYLPVSAVDLNDLHNDQSPLGPDFHGSSDVDSLALRALLRVTVIVIKECKAFGA